MVLIYSCQPAQDSSSTYYLPAGTSSYSSSVTYRHPVSVSSLSLINCTKQNGATWRITTTQSHHQLKILRNCSNKLMSQWCHLQTNSAAVAERPRNALCLLVISFNSTVRRAQSSHWLLWLQIYRCLQWNSVLFFSLRRAWVTVCAVNTVTVYVIHNYTNDRQLLIAHCSSHWSIASYSFRMVTDLCLHHLHLMPPLERSPLEYRCDVWTGKTRLVWLSDGENFSKLWILILTEFANVMDGQTPRDGIDRTCIASYGRNSPKINK